MSPLQDQMTVDYCITSKYMLLLMYLGYLNDHCHCSVTCILQQESCSKKVQKVETNNSTEGKMVALSHDHTLPLSPSKICRKQKYALQYM